MTRRIVREPLTSRQAFALRFTPDEGGRFLIALAAVCAIFGVLITAGGHDVPGEWHIGVTLLVIAAVAAVGVAVGVAVERAHTIEVPRAQGLAIHVLNGVKAWRSLPPLLRAEAAPLLHGLYDAATVAAAAPDDAALRKRVVDRVLLLQKIRQVHESTDEVARRQAAEQARGALDDTDLAEGDYTLTVLLEGLRALGADDDVLARCAEPDVTAMAQAQAAAVKRSGGHDRHVRYHGDGVRGCEHCEP